MSARAPGIAPMTLEDIDEVLAIERAVFNEPWARAHFEHEIGSSAISYARVVRSEGELVGYLVAWIVWDELHLGNVAVHPDRQHQGIATVMLEEMLDEALARGCRTATLEVRVSNERAIALYTYLGFKPVAIRRRYYRDNGEDALIMMAELAGGASAPGDGTSGEQR